MSHKWRMMFSAALLFLCGASLSRASGQNLPDDKGRAEFVHNCTACHRADMVLAVKKTPDEWRRSVDDMAARGTDGTKEDLDNVVLYLDKYFSTDKPSKPPAPSAHPQTALQQMNVSSATLRRYVTAGVDPKPASSQRHVRSAS